MANHLRRKRRKSQNVPIEFQKLFSVEDEEEARIGTP